MLYNIGVVNSSYNQLKASTPCYYCSRRLQWFGAVRYNIGGVEFSCNDIEHGVLRGNAPSPASIGVLLGRPRWASNTFKKKDPRARLVRS